MILFAYSHLFLKHCINNSERNLGSLVFCFGGLKGEILVIFFVVDVGTLVYRVMDAQMISDLKYIGARHASLVLVIFRFKCSFPFLDAW